MSDPWNRVGFCGQTGPISLEQPDLTGTNTFVYPAWMLCFGNFAGSGHQQHNIALAVSFSFLSAIVRTILAQKWRPRLLSRGILTARFKDHYWGQNGSTLKACKIVAFNARRLKLWNRVFDKVKQNKKQKQISLHRHFKLTRNSLINKIIILFRWNPWQVRVNTRLPS